MTMVVCCIFPTLVHKLKYLSLELAFADHLYFVAKYLIRYFNGYFFSSMITIKNISANYVI